MNEKTPEEYFESQRKPNSISILSLFEDYFNGKIDEGSLLSIFIKSIVDITRSLTNEKFSSEENQLVLQKMYPNIIDSPSDDIIEKVFMFSRKFERERNVYKDYRKSLQKEGVKLAPDSKTWETDDVIVNIDEHLKTFDPDLTFKRYVEMALRTIKKEDLTNYDLFIFSYMVLDLLGYKQDELPKKTNTVKNIYNDAEHAFYGAYCDYFITNDKNLREKAAVLYREFHVPTKILCSNEFIEIMNESLLNHTNEGSLINDAIELLRLENIKLNKPLANPLYKDAEQVEYSLPKFYFDFFDTAITYSYPSERKLFIEFQKPSETSYRLFYTSELQKLFEKIYFNITGQKEIDVSQEIINSFVQGSENIIFEWHHSKGYFQLKRELPALKPILIFFIELDKNKI